MEKEMMVSGQFPPNYREIKAFFPDIEAMKPVFCWGNVIHNPFGIQITPDLLEHESVHARQQGNSPDAWWMRWLKEPGFRLSQEVEAYRAQYRYVFKRVKDREALSWYLGDLAKALASPLYGSIVEKGEARQLIKN